jgi:hypothetical protein
MGLWIFMCNSFLLHPEQYYLKSLRNNIQSYYSNLTCYFDLRSESFFECDDSSLLSNLYKYCFSIIPYHHSSCTYEVKSFMFHSFVRPPPVSHWWKYCLIQNIEVFVFIFKSSLILIFIIIFFFNIYILFHFEHTKHNICTQGLKWWKRVWGSCIILSVPYSLIQLLGY